jgi:hypothetical protein
MLTLYCQERIKSKHFFFFTYTNTVFVKQFKVFIINTIILWYNMDYCFISVELYYHDIYIHKVWYILLTLIKKLVIDFYLFLTCTQKYFSYRTLVYCINVCSLNTFQDKLSLYKFYIANSKKLFCKLPDWNTPITIKYIWCMRNMWEYRFQILQGKESYNRAWTTSSGQCGNPLVGRKMLT